MTAPSSPVRRPPVADHLVEELHAALDGDEVRDPARLALALLGLMRQARRASSLSAEDA